MDEKILELISAGKTDEEITNEILAYPGKKEIKKDKLISILVDVTLRAKDEEDAYNQLMDIMGYAKQEYSFEYTSGEISGIDEIPE